MFTKNSITLIGNLGGDAETRFTTTNVSVTTFSMVTENSYKDKNDEWVNDPTWHKVVMFDVSDYHKDNLKKGKTVHVEGRQVNRSFNDKDGNKRYVSEVIGNKRDLIIFGVSRNNGTSEATASDPTPVAQPDDDLPF